MCVVDLVAGSANEYGRVCDWVHEATLYVLVLLWRARLAYVVEDVPLRLPTGIDPAFLEAVEGHRMNGYGVATSVIYPLKYCRFSLLIGGSQFGPTWPLQLVPTCGTKLFPIQGLWQ